MVVVILLLAIPFPTRSLRAAFSLRRMKRFTPVFAATEKLSAAKRSLHGQTARNRNLIFRRIWRWHWRSAGILAFPGRMLSEGCAPISGIPTL